MVRQLLAGGFTEEEVEAILVANGFTLDQAALIVDQEQGRRLNGDRIDVNAEPSGAQG